MTGNICSVAVAAVLIASLSGGFLFGSVPLMSEAVDSGLIGADQSSFIYNAAFQMLTFASALAGVATDRFGPRMIAIVGLLLEALGHLGLAILAHPEGRDSVLALDAGVSYFALAYGAVGSGGAVLYIASLPIAATQHYPALAATILSVCYGITGLVPLAMWALQLAWQPFFIGLSLMSLVAVAVVGLTYPTQCVGHACPVEKQNLYTVRMGTFFFVYAWVASICAWATSVIFARSLLLHCKNEMAYAQPFVFLVTSAIAGPTVGQVVQTCGILPAAISLLLAAGASLFGLLVASTAAQLFVALSMVGVCSGMVYSLQVAVPAVESPTAIGTSVSFSVVAQFAVQWLSLFVTDWPEATVGTMWAVPLTLFGPLWLMLIWQRRGAIDGKTLPDLQDRLL